MPSRSPLASLAAEMKFTRRQKILVDRLAVLGDWACTGRLPAPVLEILGFGSFFRGKPNPTDVDLLVRISRPEPSPQFSRFMECVEIIRWERRFQRKFGSPAGAMRVLLDERSGDGSLQESDAVRFLEWLDGYSWNMLLPSTLFGQGSMRLADGFVLRFVKQRLPRINIFRLLNPGANTAEHDGMRCGFLEPIWSPESPDITGNLERALSPETVWKNILRELAHFEFQREVFTAQIARLEAHVVGLRSLKESPGEDGFRWFRPWEEAQPLLVRLKATEVSAEAALSTFQRERWGKDCRPRSVPSDLAEGVRLADEIRDLLEEMCLTIDFLKSVRSSLIEFYSGKARPAGSADEYVTRELLGSGTERQRQQRFERLRSMGFLGSTSVPG